MSEDEMRARLSQLHAEIDHRRAEIIEIEKRLSSPHVVVVGKYWRQWSEYEDQFTSVDEAIDTLVALSDRGNIGEYHVYVGGVEIVWDAHSVWANGQPANWVRPGPAAEEDATN